MDSLEILPALVFAVTAIAELILCVYTLHSGRTKFAGVLVLLFHDVGSQGLIRDSSVILKSPKPFESRLQNITFGTISCCFGFTYQINCQPLPGSLSNLDIALYTANKLRDSHALESIASGIISTSLSWAIALTTLLIITVALVFGHQHTRFFAGFRKFGKSLKVLVLLWSIALGSFLTLPFVYPMLTLWDLQKIVGMTVEIGPANEYIFAALCCFIIITFCASFICSRDM